MDVHASLRHVADLLEDELDSVVADMDAAIAASVPTLFADVAFAAEASASSRANVRRFIAVARRADDPLPPDVPLEAFDLARTVVRRGIDTDVIYGGYRHGQETLLRRWMAIAEREVAPADYAAVMNITFDLLFRYVDAILTQIVATMQRERDQVLGGALARRAETIRLVLDGAPLGATVAGQRLGYDLARHHTALIVWSETAATTPLEDAAQAIARAVQARYPLTLSAGTTTLWAWIGSDAPLDQAALARGASGTDVRVAIGPTRRGMAGFRRSHEAAASVQALLSGNPEAGRVATYEELEVTALAAQDAQRAAEFVTATLGPLAEDNATAARLRETLRVFFDEADNAPRAAARLHTHRNTVLQRVGRATELLGHPPGERRLAISLALELRRRLG